jgi:hypothetical protein
MFTALELRHTCLLLAANSYAYQAPGTAHGSRAVQQNLRFALYMLVAISLRRRGIGRHMFRRAATNPNAALASQRRFGASNNSALRAHYLSRLAGLLPSLPHKRGCIAVAYQ